MFEQKSNYIEVKNNNFMKQAIDFYNIISKDEIIDYGEVLNEQLLNLILCRIIINEYIKVNELKNLPENKTITFIYNYNNKIITFTSGFIKELGHFYDLI